MADVAEPADVELRAGEAREVQPVSGIDLVGVFAQGHMGQVQEPADLEVVGELAEVFGEMADRQPRAVGIGVHGRGGDGQDAGAVAPAHQAVVVLPPPQSRHPLEVDHRGQELARQPLILLDERPQSLQDPVRLLGLTFIIQQVGLHVQQRDLVLASQFGIAQPAVGVLDAAIAQAVPPPGDLRQRGLRLPPPHQELHRPEAAGIQHDPVRAIVHARDEGTRWSRPRTRRFLPGAIDVSTRFVATAVAG